MKRKRIIQLGWVLSLVSMVSLVKAQTIHGSFDSKFNRYQKGQVFGGAPNLVWGATAWKGDRIHKQLIIWSNQEISGLSYEVGDLIKDTDKIPSDRIRLRFGKYVKGDAEAHGCAAYDVHSTNIEIADALSEKKINDLNINDPIKIWLTIDVPQSAVAGMYSGTVKVRGGLSDLIFNINLEIVDYTLPAVSQWAFHLDLWQFPTKVLDHYNQSNPGDKIDLWSSAHYALLEPSYRKLVDMGQKSITTYIKGGSLGAPSMVTWTLKPSNAWVYDFTVFDNHVNTLMSWGISKQISCFSPVGWNESTIPYFDETSGTAKDLDAPIESLIYNERWDHFLTAFKAHLEDKGWFDKTILYLDEVTEDKLEAVTSMVHGNHADWKLGIAYAQGLSVASKANFHDLSGILEDASNEGILESKISTFYTSCTQTIPNNYVTPENNPAEMTWMGWHATNQNYDGYLRWAFDYWQNNDPFDIRDGAHTAGDFSMIYRNSNNSPMTYSSSIRMEMLREGIQDYEKVKILKGVLASSKDSFDQQALEALNEMILKFGKTTGIAAESLIIEAQELVRKIARGGGVYCRVAGSQDSYYLSRLATSGGDQNIDYSIAAFPEGGYKYYTSTVLSLLPGSSFNVELENSRASNCAIIKAWIDWNGNDSFEDDGEEVYVKGQLNSCENSISHSFQVAVPDLLTPGKVRMRVRIGESGNSLEPCGTNNASGSVDFDVLIKNKYCQPSGDTFQDYFLTKLTTQDGVDGENIDYSGKGFPQNGYIYVSAQQVVMELGKTFAMTLKNSAKSKCAQTSAWIDWNADGDFDDEGEAISSIQNKLQSCDNAISKTINIEVPISAVVGLTRLRVRLRNSWLGSSTPCSKLTSSSTVDFDVKINKGTITTLREIIQDTIVFPNPGKDFFEINGLSGRVKICVLTTSGKLISIHDFDQLNSSSVRIKTQSLEPGAYLIQVLTAQGKSQIYKYINL